MTASGWRTWCRASAPESVEVVYRHARGVALELADLLRPLFREDDFMIDRNARVLEQLQVNVVPRRPCPRPRSAAAGPRHRRIRARRPAPALEGYLSTLTAIVPCAAEGTAPCRIRPSRRS